MGRSPRTSGLLLGLAFCVVIAFLAVIVPKVRSRWNDRQSAKSSKQKGSHPMRHLRSVTPSPPPSIGSAVDADNEVRHPLPRLALAGLVLATPERVPVGRICTARGTPIMASPSEVDIVLV